MNLVILFETIMLILFGCSWPFNIAKSLKSRTTLGKSIIFEIIIVVGYFFGITAKILTYVQTGNLHYSICIYFLDVALVLTDICIYCRNYKIDKENGRL